MSAGAVPVSPSRPGEFTRIEIPRSLELSIANRDVFAGHEFSAQGAAQVSGVEAANVAAADESDDRFGHEFSQSLSGILPSFYGPLAHRRGTDSNGTRYSVTRPPAEEITWGRK